MNDEALATAKKETPEGQLSLTELLDQIEARANAATPGPWQFVNRDDNQFVSAGNIYVCALAGIFAHTEDFQFIAAARTDVPALVKALRRAITDLEWQFGGKDPELLAHRKKNLAQLLSEPADSVIDAPIQDTPPSNPKS